MVQDPNFWRRFSIAVHNDEAAILAKDGGKETGETKHAYVLSLSSPITTPTSQCHLSPAFPPATFSRPVSTSSIALEAEKATKEEARRSRATSGTKSVYFDASEEPKLPEMIALHKLPSSSQSLHTKALPSLPSTPHSSHFAATLPPPPPPPPPSPPAAASKRGSKRTSRSRMALSSHPPTLPPTPKSARFPHSLPSPTGTRSGRTSRFIRTHGNGSRLSLGISLSGRPKSAFKFWTTIEADTSANRDSWWLESQQRKARQRTWMCWAFWMTFLVLVVGAIVTVLVLRGKGII